MTVSAERERLLGRLQSTIDEMLVSNETISTRALMNRLPEDFTYPSAVTRPADTRQIYQSGRDEQKRLREMAASLSHSSPNALRLKITKQSLKITEPEAQIEVLVASHRALYAAVGEMGGAQAWLRFFNSHQQALAILDNMEARPNTAEPIKLHLVSESPDRSPVETDDPRDL